MNTELADSERERGKAELFRLRCSPFRVPRLGFRPRAFSLVELIAVLAAIAILAAALAPALIRHMDRIVGERESAALKSFGDALQQSIRRNRYIPSHTDWATTVATELGVDVANVTINPRNQPRFFLIDPNWQIGSTVAGQSYQQTNSGSSILPVNPRVLMLSSIGTSLPGGITNGFATPANFTNIWNGADGTVPTNAPAFAGWTGNGEDVKVQRVNLSSLFV